MTAEITHIIEDVENLGWCILGYHHGQFYVSGLRWRDLDWCFRTIRLGLTPSGRKVA